MKPYVKPVIIYEPFALSQSIAVCGFDMNWSEAMHCVAQGDPEYQDSSIVLLLDWCGENDISKLGMDGLMYCYHNGSPEEGWMRVYIS